MQRLQEEVLAGTRKLEELNASRDEILGKMEQITGGPEGLSSYRGATEFLGVASSGVVGGVMDAAQYQESILEQKASFDESQKDNLIIQAMNSRARQMVKKNLEEDYNEVLELHEFIKEGSGEKLAKMMKNDSSKSLRKLVANEDRILAKQNVNEMIDEIKELQKPGNISKIKNDSSSLKGLFTPKVKPNIVNSLPSKREKSALENVVNRIDQGTRSRNTKDLEVKNALERLSQQENLNKELKEKTDELNSKESNLNAQISTLKATLDKALETAESESKDIEKLEQSIKDRVTQSRNTQKKVSEVKSNNSSSKARTRGKRSSIIRPTVANKFKTLGPISSFSKQSQSAQSSTSTTASEVQSLPPTRIAVDLIQEDISIGTPVLTLQEFSKIADKDLKISNPSAKVSERVIVHTPNGEVLMQAVYKNGKAVEYEIIEAVDEKELAKELVRERTEIIGLKEEIFKYDEFLEILNSSKK